MKIEKIYRNMDAIVRWIEYLADGQDSRFGREEADGYL